MNMETNNLTYRHPRLSSCRLTSHTKKEKGGGRKVNAYPEEYEKINTSFEGPARLKKNDVFK